MAVSYDHRIIHQRVSPGDIADMEDYHDDETITKFNVSNIYSSSTLVTGME